MHKLVSLTHAARILNLDVRTLRKRAIDTGEMSFLRVSGRRFIHTSDLERWLANKKERGGLACHDTQARCTSECRT